VTPYDLLLAFPNRTRPFVTDYAGPDVRVELSVASVANGVAKAAGLLRDGLGLCPGDTVSLDLPRHWQLPIWTLAALTAGARCGRRLPGRVAVRLIGPDALPALREGADPGADEVLVAACDTFGLPVSDGVPAGVLDVGVEARVHPDVHSPDPGAAAVAVLVGASGERRWADLLAAGAGPAVRMGQRLWVDESTPEPLLVATAMAPLLAQGSVVLARGLTPDQARRIRRAEGVGA
jgi:uncharacterized protein (TIGR03089 family)